MHNTSTRWWHTILLAGILSLAAFLRFYRLDLGLFYADTARDLTIASDVATGQSFPLLGPVLSQSQAYLGPAYFYLLAVPFFFVRHPLAGSYFVALSNVVAVYVLFQFSKAFFGLTVAAVAAALFAVFPLALWSARTIWNPGFLPLFTLLFMRALYALIVQENSRAFIALLPLLAILMQLHFTAVSLIVVVLLALLLFWPRMRGWHAVIGLAGFLLCYSPYIVYECTHAFANTRAMLQFIRIDQHMGGQRTLPTVLGELLLLFPSALRGLTTGYPWPLPFLRGFFMLYGLEALLFCAGIVLTASVLITGRRTSQHAASGVYRPCALLLLWLIVPTLIIGNKKTGSWFYYLDLLYPSQFIFAAIALAPSRFLTHLPSWAHKGNAWLSSGVVLSVVLTQGFFHVALQQKIAREGEIVVDVPQLWLGPAPSSPFTVRLLPLGYRSAIIRTLWHEFGLDTPSLTEKVHGAAFGDPQDSESWKYPVHWNQPFIRYLASEVPQGSLKRAVAALHYLVTRGQVDTSGLAVLRSHRIGPYAILEYRPGVDYAGWSFATGSSLTPDGTLAGRWHKLALPATNFGLALAHQEKLFLQGTLQLPATREGVQLAVSVVGEAPFEVRGVQVSGEQMPAMARVVQQNGPAWIVETVFERNAPLVGGVHEVGIEVAGLGRILSIDVYEGRSLPSR